MRRLATASLLALGILGLGPRRALGDEPTRPLLARLADEKDPGRAEALAAWKVLSPGDRALLVRDALRSSDPGLAFIAARLASPWTLDLEELRRRQRALAPDPLADFGDEGPLHDVASRELAFGAPDLPAIWKAIAERPPDPDRVDYSALHRALLPEQVPLLVPLLETAKPLGFHALLEDLSNEASNVAGDEQHADYVRAFRFGLARLLAEAGKKPVPRMASLPAPPKKAGLPAEFVELARASWGPEGKGFDLARLPQRKPADGKPAAPRPPLADGPDRWLARWALRLVPVEEDLPFLLETVQSARAPIPTRWWAARRIAAFGGRAAGHALAQVLAAGDDASVFGAAEAAAHGNPDAWASLQAPEKPDARKRFEEARATARWLADPVAARTAAWDALRKGDTSSELEEDERWFAEHDVGIVVRDEDLRWIAERLRKEGAPVEAEAWFVAKVLPEALTKAEAERLAARWAGEAAKVTGLYDDTERAIALIDAVAPEAAVALLRRLATDADGEDAKKAALLLLARAGDAALADRLIASWPSWPGRRELLGRVHDPKVEAFLREQATSKDVEVESDAVAALAILYGCPEPLARYFDATTRGDADPKAAAWDEAKALVLGKDPVGGVLLRTAEGPNVGVSTIEATAGFGLVAEGRVLQRLRAWRDDRGSGLHWVATATLALSGDAEARAEWTGFLGDARTFLLDDLQEARLFTLGGDPAQVDAWVARLDANCCLAWHAQTVLAKTFPTFPFAHAPGGAGRTRRGAERWFAAHRGTFVPSRLLDGLVPVAR